MTNPTEDKIALARRAVACKGWRWMPGMLVRFRQEPNWPGGRSDFALRVDCDGNDGDAIGKESSRYLFDQEVDGDRVFDLRPDLADPATLGCLLALVREAWGPGGEAMSASPQSGVIVGRVTGLNGSGLIVATGATEAEALVAALEAAPDHAAASAAEM